MSSCGPVAGLSALWDLDRLQPLQRPYSRAHVQRMQPGRELVLMHHQLRSIFMALPDLKQNQDGTTTLRVPQGGALIFTMAWHADDGTQIPIEGASGAVRDHDTDTIQLDFEDYIVIDGDGGVTVNVPASVTGALTDWGSGFWNFRTTKGGNVLFALEGHATLRPGGKR